MAGLVLDGKGIAEKLRGGLIQRARRIIERRGRAPRLVALQIGCPASAAVYARAQAKAAGAVGIDYQLLELPESADPAAAGREIARLNADASVDAIILQLPLPKGMDARMLIAGIDPDKDAECLHPANLGRVVLGHVDRAPCTAMAVMELIRATGESLRGKEAVVVGHSEIVGKPLALMLLGAFATTTVCHIATGERGILADHVRRAEVLVVAVGKPGVVPGDWIRPGAIVIDVGINKIADKIVGDIGFDAARDRAAFITPVPGGVGALTTMMLMQNTLTLCEARSGT